VALELFNAIMDHIMTEATSRLSFWLKFGDRVISDADFADDLAFLADPMDQLLEALRNVQEEAIIMRLQINWDKTKSMAKGPSPSIVNSPVLSRQNN